MCNGLTRSNYYSSTGLTAIVDGNLHQLAFSAVRSGNVTFYLDGVSVGTAGISARVAQDVQGTRDLILSSSSSAFDLIGAIDNTYLYNRALSAGEVAELYARPFGMFQPTFYTWWGRIGGAPPATYGQVIMISN